MSRSPSESLSRRPTGYTLAGYWIRSTTLGARSLSEVVHTIPLGLFTTSSTDFALKGYEVRALDYMVKPIRYDKFSQTMEYFLSVSRRKQSHYIEVKESRIMLKIPIDSILYTDYSNHYIQIHLPDKTVRTYMRFEDFSGMLLMYSQFICCYRNCIINMDKVFSMEKSEFILTTGEHLPITRTMRSQIHQQYADYQFSKLNGGI